MRDSIGHVTTDRKRRNRHTAQDLLLACEELIQRLSEILQQVKSVGNLRRLRRSLAGAVGKRPTAIATHHLDLSPPCCSSQVAKVAASRSGNRSRIRC